MPHNLTQTVISEHLADGTMTVGDEIALRIDLPPDPAFQRGSHRLADTHSRLLGNAQYRCHGVGHRSRISHGGQFENPDTVRELIAQARGDLQGQTGLAHPAHPGQCHQPVFMERLFHLVDLGLAPDETGRRTPQVSRACVQRPQQRKLGPESGCSNLKHPDWGRQVPQPPRPQIQQINPKIGRASCRERV